ncbi:MAG: heavy metal-associated domain-containing protein [Silvibacterium sp.]
MIRRQFIKLATLTGATGLASLSALDALETNYTKTVTWRVRGFTCVTCAVGLEVMLRRQKGVKSAEASYPDATVTIQFHPELVSEASLRSFITDIGFTADEQKG